MIETVKRVSGVDSQVELAGDVPAIRRRSSPLPIAREHLLNWQPQFDDLSTIVSHALAWERKLQDPARS